MKRLHTLVAASLLSLAVAPLRARADAGVLIPGDATVPNPAILSLQEMHVDVLIDNGDARVRIVQIFANHGPTLQQGTYQFALPNASTISDFAVWDGPVRIPAVVLERKRAEEIYDEARMQAIDPGLLEMGERTDEPTTTSLFTAKIVPIPGYGTKRLELEYHQRITVNDFKQVFLLPLKPDAYQKQTAKRFSIHFELRSSHAVEDFQLPSTLFPLKMSVANGNHGVGTFEGTDVSLSEDFVAHWKLNRAAADSLRIITYRSQHVALPQPDEISPQHEIAQPGFFQADMLVGDGKLSVGNTADASAPRTIVVLFDNSLSMQWEKLERSYAALEGILNKLRPTDRFNVILFNQDITSWRPTPVAADTASIAAARTMVRNSRLRGGTDLGKALAEGLKQCDAANSVLVVLTDGGSDRGKTILPGKIVANYAHAWNVSAYKPKTDIFAVGDDANVTLLGLLARNNGVMEHVLSTEPVEYKLEAFLGRLTRSALADLALTTKPEDVKMVYPLDSSIFTGSLASWVGTYNKPTNQIAFTASGRRDDASFNASTVADLPATAEEHTQLPRLWAQERVNALLEQIAGDGETRAAVDEIIRLSRKYKFVTPYTSFLAVPRSLLRPRVIRPGDPILRVRTDEAIESVIAIFPFGLTKELRHLSGEDTRGPDGGRLWETRFLAPVEMKDGTYPVRLVLRDTHGNTYREEKTFVIASTPPTVRILLPGGNVHRGNALMIKASASQSTRNLTARLTGPDFESSPIALRWSTASAANVGRLDVPVDLPIGCYRLSVTAEDIAHNMGSQEVQVDVIP